MKAYKITFMDKNTVKFKLVDKLTFDWIRSNRHGNKGEKHGVTNCYQKRTQKCV